MAGESLMVVVTLVLLFGCKALSGTVFTVVNRCSYTIWAVVLTGDCGASLAGCGFALTTQQSRHITVLTVWLVRLLGRMGCAFDASGAGWCATGDCGCGLEYNGAGGVPPATLAEFNLGDTDFHDVSVVDGFNVPLSISTDSGTGDCREAACVANLQHNCPAKLRVKGSGGRVISCKSACEEFGSPEYCCTKRLRGVRESGILLHGRP